MPTFDQTSFSGNSFESNNQTSSGGSAAFDTSAFDSSVFNSTTSDVVSNVSAFDSGTFDGSAFDNTTQSAVIGDHRLIFDGVNKTIYVLQEASTIASIDIRTDLYSKWKEWVIISDNSKYLQALRVSGGDPIGNGQFTGDVYFLINGWKFIVDFEKVKITGVLFSDDYDTAYWSANSGNPLYPAFVLSIVNLISTSGSYGSSISAADVWNYQNRTLSQPIVYTGPTTQQIAEQVRSELAPELAHVLTLENQTSGLTPTQATMLLEMYDLLGLDPTKPLVVTETGRTAGTISQAISSLNTETIVTRM